MTTIIEKCKHVLSQDEVRERADSLARKLGEITTQQEQKKEICARIKNEIDRLTNETKALAAAVISNYEWVDTECAVELDYAKSEVRVLRLDTGEVLRCRTMTSAEKQAELPGVVKEDEDEDDIGTPSQHLDKDKKLEIVREMTAEAAAHINGVVPSRAVPPSAHKGPFRRVRPMPKGVVR